MFQGAGLTERWEKNTCLFSDRRLKPEALFSPPLIGALSAAAVLLLLLLLLFYKWRQVCLGFSLYEMI